MASSTTSAISTHDQLVRARHACSQLAQFSSEQKNSILLAMADELERNVNDILAANRADLEACGLSGPMLDRLSLNPERVSAMAEGIREVVQ
jgi:glutamate-5-semialdehyde dehydrogenase